MRLPKLSAQSAWVSTWSKVMRVSTSTASRSPVRAFSTVGQEQAQWLELGRRCLAVLRRTQRAGDAIDVADLILAHIDDTDLAGEVESQAAQALWLGGQLTQLLTRVERVLASGPHAPPAAAMKAFSTVASGATKTCNYWPLWPCWIGLFFVIGTAVADPTFTDIIVEEAELAAQRNPGVASFEGLALNVRGRSTGNLAMIAQSAQVLARSPRPLLRAFGAESLGHALLAHGDRSAGLTQLD